MEVMKMFDISTPAYEFPCPPDYDWLPSSFALFDGDGVSEKVSARSETDEQCQQEIVIRFDLERGPIRPR